MCARVRKGYGWMMRPLEQVPRHEVESLVWEVSCWVTGFRDRSWAKGRIRQDSRVCEMASGQAKNSLEP